MLKDAPVENLPHIGPSFAKKLERLGIFTISDLFFHIPRRYLDFTKLIKIRDFKIGDTSVISGEIISIVNQYTRSGKQIQIAQVADESGKLTVIWFNQSYLTRILYPGVKVSMAGTLSWFGNKPALVSPDYELLKEDKSVIHTQGLVPIYPETSGLTSKWIRNIISQNNKYSEIISEYLPANLLNQFNLLAIEDAISIVHKPKSLGEVSKSLRRLSVEELLSLHLSSLEIKNLLSKYKAPQMKYDEKLIKSFVDNLPFKLTVSQEEVLKDLLADIQKETPMNRLLEGDVGSGKTIVALITALVAFSNGYQTAIMAPTQILAEQHYQTIQNVFNNFKIRIRFITGKIDKSDIGKTDIFIGTHSLLEKKDIFEKVGLVVIDEQHKFGVSQRQKLLKNVSRGRKVPHLLTMTATPIPRTIALTAYGDMDLSVIKEMPEGRQKIKTWVINKSKVESAKKWIKKEIQENKIQAYIVYPLIEESDKETLQTVKSVKAEFIKLSKEMHPLKLGLLHGKLKPDEKNSVIENFKSGKVDILVSTPVVEVGIDVPNACIMVVEGADRFGLSSLHQLRGRVGRGSKQSYCMLLSENTSKKALARLKAMEKYHSGFDLAEIDLSLRGPGEIFGLRQHGIPELRIAHWQEFELIRDSKKLAEYVYRNPELRTIVTHSNHFILAGVPKIV